MKVAEAIDIHKVLIRSTEQQLAACPADDTRRKATLSRRLVAFNTAVAAMAIVEQKNETLDSGSAG